MKTLILGLGNELYGDDGVGLHVVRHLKREFSVKKKPSGWAGQIEFVECSLSGLSLLDIIIGYDRLIIVDTIKKQSPKPGRIHLMDVQDLRHIPGPSPHYVSVPQTLEIGKALGLKVPAEVKIIAVEAKIAYHLGEGISEEMRKRLPRIAAKTKEIIIKSGKWDKMRERP